MKRNTFLKLSSSSALALSLSPRLLFGSPVSSAEVSSARTLTILHTNDQHSRIEPFDQNAGRNAHKGGFARRAELISRIRREEKGVLLLDSGDIFQGTPYFNMFGGALEFKLMSMMGYDAATMGNHDFDNGLEGFVKVLPEAKFPFITSNYDFSNTLVEGRTEPYRVVERNGLRIGLLGLGIELEGLVGKKQFGETKYLDPVEMANHYAALLKTEKKCDLVVCLSHLGYRYRDSTQISDVVLAERTKGIDLILGGHTHTFLPEPQNLINAAGTQVLVNQVGFAGLMLGRLDYTFDRQGSVRQITYQNTPVESPKGFWS